jgi:chaperonin GroEL (HSP60 family)
MIKSGIIDPLKVIRTALVDAARYDIDKFALDMNNVFGILYVA